jgi:general secretion pathway protein A
MYYSHFGFHRRPFPPAPDDSCYYPATSHELALTRLEQSLQDDEGLVLLTGEAGTGKTLLCHCLLNRFPETTVTAFLTNSYFDNRHALLQAILYDFALVHDGTSVQELRLRLTDFLLDNYSRGQKALLIVDEAHHLTPDLLEELRLLTNLEAGGDKAIQLVLSAQPAIMNTLSQPGLTSLNQRLASRASLEVLEAEEAIDYLLHHVRMAGGQPESLFTTESLELLAEASRGVPRFLNQLGHQSLVLAHTYQMEQVDGEVVYEARLQLGLGEEQTSEQRPDARHISFADRPISFSPGKARTVLQDGPDLRDEVEGDVLSYRLYDPPRRPA